MSFPEYAQECLDAAQGKWPASGMGWGGVTFEDPPAEKRKDRPKSIRVFRSEFMEKVLGRSHPILPIVWFGPFLAYGIYRGVADRGALVGAGLFFLGWLFWTLIEYLLHRGIFHMGAKTPDQRFRAFMIHGYHHEFPNDKLRLVAPPLMSWPIGAVVAVIYYFSFGATMWWPVFAGTVTGYVAYDWIHYYTHHFKPTNRVGKWLKQYHLLHHFDENHGSKRYGVSNPLWDFVFGTYMPVKKATKE
jgi:sterol desaturase/sphingolipid hydroxylase (fatty acid hydroxylase superfamily)